MNGTGILKTTEKRIDLQNRLKVEGLSGILQRNNTINFIKR